MYILTLGKNSKVGQKMIDRLIRIHETPQDPVVVTHSEIELPDGYAIVKFDGLVRNLVAVEPKLMEEASVKKALHAQNERISKEKFFNK